MKAFGLAFLLLCMLVLPAMAGPVAAPTVEQIGARVAKPQVLRGQFEQTKTVKGFRNPLRSTGSFVVARDHGVIWKTEKPFASELVITADQIRSRQADGSQRVEVDASQQPAMRSFNAVMFSLISGDMTSLAKVFRIEPVATGTAAWQLRLTPRSRMLERAFTELQLQGDRHVSHVDIVEASGDRTRIVFKALTESPSSLRAEEASRFE